MKCSAYIDVIILRNNTEVNIDTSSSKILSNKVAIEKPIYITLDLMESFSKYAASCFKYNSYSSDF